MELRKIKPSKRGVLGLDTAKAFVIAIMTLGVIAFAAIIAMNSLNNSSAGTQATTDIFGNISDGVVSLFTNAGTWFSLIAVVVIILIIAVVIIAVNRFGGVGAGNL